MNVIIAEDEMAASRKLEALLLKQDPSIKVRATLESVKDTLIWLKENPPPDLGFFDIQLADDTSFRIFEKWKIDFPVVFVTAYDDYILKAFEHNSIHYLLKPITEEKISMVLAKLRQFEKHFISHAIAQYLAPGGAVSLFNKRIIVRKGIDQWPLETKEVAYFFTEHKVSFAKTKDNITYLTDHTLSELEELVDPDIFFRANRQYILNIAAVVKFRSLESSKLKIDLQPESKEDVFVAKERSAAFKNWIKGK